MPNTVANKEIVIASCRIYNDLLLCSIGQLEDSFGKAISGGLSESRFHLEDLIDKLEDDGDQYNIVADLHHQMGVFKNTLAIQRDQTLEECEEGVSLRDMLFQQILNSMENSQSNFEIIAHHYIQEVKGDLQ